MGRSFGGGRSGGGGGRSFGGGGGRSFGGGGGRSFGGGGGRSFGGGGGRSGGGFHIGAPRTRTVFIPIGRWGSFGGGGNRSNGNGGGQSSCIGCFSTLVGLIIFFLIFSTLIRPLSGSSSPVSPSTVKREPLPEGCVVETGYYTDELGWITNSSELTQGMEQFYHETGIQPYLYLFDNIDGNYYPSSSQVEAFAYSLYDELFEDEAHLLVLFWEYDNEHQTWYLAGTQASSVFDDEAADIFLDNVERYYYDQSLDEETFFSKAFSDTAQRIMKVTTSPLVIIGISVAIVAVLLILFTWWKRAKEEKRKEQERIKDILETPLESFGDLETEEIAKKYEASQPSSGDRPSAGDSWGADTARQRGLSQEQPENPGGESSPPVS